MALRIHRGGPIAVIALCFVLLFSYRWFSNRYEGAAWKSPVPQQLPHSESTATFQQDINGSTIYQVADVSEDVLFDGTIRYTRKLRLSQPSLLFLVLTQDSSSWGHDANTPDRTFYDFLQLLSSAEIDLSSVSLGLLTNSAREYDLFRQAVSNTSLSRVTIFSEPQNDYTMSRDSRHTNNRELQNLRRSYVAQLRNKLMHRTLADEEHILWLDADIDYLSPRIIQTMLAHSESNQEAGIITARCQEGPTKDYDKNAWAGGRPGPDGIPGTESSDARIAQQEKGVVQRHVGELIKGTSNDALIPLDAVGGTILYMRAALVLRGLYFPPSLVIGTRWGRDGWDGIESEGLCYVARGMRGGQCFVLGGRHHVRHTNF